MWTAMWERNARKLCAPSREWGYTRHWHGYWLAPRTCTVKGVDVARVGAESGTCARHLTGRLEPRLDNTLPFQSIKSVVPPSPSSTKKERMKTQVEVLYIHTPKLHIYAKLLQRSKSRKNPQSNKRNTKYIHGLITVLVIGGFKTST